MRRPANKQELLRRLKRRLDVMRAELFGAMKIESINELTLRTGEYLSAVDYYQRLERE